MTYGTPQWRPWVLEEADSRPFIKRALEHGINFFDTADMYSRGVSERVLGRALKDFAPRDQVVIATKAFYAMGDGPNDRGLSRKHLLDAIDASLQRLGVDHVDLYQIHRFDPQTSIEETLEALHDIVKAGKARYIGASSMDAWQFAKMLYVADRHGWTRFVSMQNHYNLVYREEEREMLPLCREEGIGVIPWSPLARGFLAGNRRKQDLGDTTRAKTDDFAPQLYYSDADFAIVDRVVELAKRRGVKPTQIALAWLLAKPGVTAPIVGASKLSHLDDHERKRQRVEQVDPADSRDGDHQSAEPRSDDRCRLKHNRVEADGVRQMLARYEHRHKRLSRRQIERAHGRGRRGQRIDRPDGRKASKRELGEAERNQRRCGLREHHQAAAVPGVGDDAAQHREDDDRHHPHEADQPERQAFLLRRHEQRDVPQERCALHRRSNEGNEQPDPDQPEVAMPQCDERLSRDHDGADAA